MFFPELLVKGFRADRCSVRDPLDVPDDEGNPPQLEKCDVAHRYGFDVIQAEEEHIGFRLWRRYGPEWMKFNLNPTSRREWSIIRKAKDWVDRRDHYPRHLKEMEIAMAEGHSRIIILPKHISEYASYWNRIKLFTHYYAMNYGVTCILCAWRYPKAWWLYLPLLYISMCNAYAHSRYIRSDRSHAYSLLEQDAVYDEVDFEPEAENVGEIDSPEQFPTAHWVLARDGRVRSTILYFRHQSAACLAAFAVSYRMGQFEEEVVGPTYRVLNLDYPAMNSCDYILPTFLDSNQGWPSFIPKEIPKVLGFTVDQWFFLGLFSFYVWDYVSYVKSRPLPTTRLVNEESSDVRRF